MNDTGDPSADARSKPRNLRERMRATVQAEVTEVALRLFSEQGFEQTTVDQIASEAGLSRASLFRYFGTKEDIVLGHLEEGGRRVAQALTARPERERPWQALRRAFDLIAELNEEAPQEALAYLRMLHETPSLRARYFEKQMTWQKLLVPEITRRMGAKPDDPQDPRPRALVTAALACLDAAAIAWVACEAAIPMPVMLDRAMGVLTD